MSTSTDAASHADWTAYANHFAALLPPGSTPTAQTGQGQ